MKKGTIIALAMLAIGMFLIITASKDVTTYATFAEASKVEKDVRVVGQLSLNKKMVYNPEVDAELFTFFMKDADGVERKVELQMPKPQDFERSEQIVVTGKMVDGVFVAKDILMKCPSKYKDEETELRDLG